MPVISLFALRSTPTPLGLTPAKGIPMLYTHWFQLGAISWGGLVDASEQKEEKRSAPSQPPSNLISSTGSKFSFYLIVPPDSMSQLL